MNNDQLRQRLTKVGNKRVYAKGYYIRVSELIKDQPTYTVFLDDKPLPTDYYFGSALSDLAAGIEEAERGGLYEVVIREGEQFRMKFPIGEGMHPQAANEIAHGLADMMKDGRKVWLLSPIRALLAEYPTGGAAVISREF